MREWAQAREAAGAARSSRKALPAIATKGSATAREVAHLTREIARLSKQLMRTEAALEIMGKLHGLAVWGREAASRHLRSPRG